jgi:serine racemase
MQVEPSGAVGLAAVLSPGFKQLPALAGCSRIGIVLCGGNLDFEARGFWATEAWRPAGAQ